MCFQDQNNFAFNHQRKMPATIEEKSNVKENKRPVWPQNGCSWWIALHKDPDFSGIANTRNMKGDYLMITIFIHGNKFSHLK